MSSRVLSKSYQSLYQAFSVYTLIFFGGLSNGLPGVLTWQALNLWLFELGYSKERRPREQRRQRLSRDYQYRKDEA